MRDIKFRAWNPNIKYMDSGTSLLEMANADDSEGKYSEDVVFLQYTGLKDKNGVEIYEGDIVRINTSGVDDRWAKNEKVLWDIRVCGFAPFCHPNWYLDDHYCEIIGNIYQSPELLEGV